MANDVMNIILVDASVELLPAVMEELKCILKDIEQGGTPWPSRTRLESFEGGEVRLVSAWGPDFRLQNYLVARLGKIDPDVVVSMRYEDETLQAVGARVAWLNVASVAEDVDLSCLLGGASSDEEREIRVVDAQARCLTKTLALRERAQAHAQQEGKW